MPNVRVCSRGGPKFFTEKQQTGSTSFTSKPSSEVIYHVWTKTLYELLQKWQLLPHLKRKRLGPNLDVMVGLGLKHAFPELPLWGNLSFTCTLLSTKPPKPRLNQTKPHKSPLHSCNSANTEMDLPEISQIPGWQRQSKGRNGIPVQRSACLSFCSCSKRGLIPTHPFLSWAASYWLKAKETHRL